MAERITSGSLTVEFQPVDGATCSVQVSFEGLDEQRGYDVIRATFEAALGPRFIVHGEEWTSA